MKSWVGPRDPFLDRVGASSTGLGWAEKMGKEVMAVVFPVHPSAPSHNVLWAGMAGSRGGRRGTEETWQGEGPWISTVTTPAAIRWRETSQPCNELIDLRSSFLSKNVHLWTLILETTRQRKPPHKPPPYVTRRRKYSRNRATAGTAWR